MKKTVFILSSCIIISLISNSANPLRRTYNNSSISTYQDTASWSESTGMTGIIADIMNVVGLKVNFEIKEARVLNIEAAISHKKRYILYNPAFIARIKKIDNSKWTLVALVAHEAGHHLNGHTIRKRGSKPQLELEADEFAGFILYKLGASMEQAQEVMKFIANPQVSHTHPGRSSRMEAIKYGWNKAANPKETIAVTKKRADTL